jgi:hypothetical protein
MPRKGDKTKKAEAFVRAVREQSLEAHTRLVGLLEGKKGAAKDVFLFALYEQVVTCLLKDGAVPSLCAEFGSSVVESLRVGSAGGEPCVECSRRDGCVPRLLHTTLDEMQEKAEPITLH